MEDSRGGMNKEEQTGREGEREKGREKKGIRIKDVDTDPIISTGDVFMVWGWEELTVEKG